MGSRLILCQAWNLQQSQHHIRGRRTTSSKPLLGVIMKRRQLPHCGVSSDRTVISSSRCTPCRGDRGGLHRYGLFSLDSGLSSLDLQHDQDQDEHSHPSDDIPEKNRIIPLINSMPLSRQRCRQTSAPVVLGRCCYQTVYSYSRRMGIAKNIMVTCWARGPTNVAQSFCSGV